MNIPEHYVPIANIFTVNLNEFQPNPMTEKKPKGYQSIYFNLIFFCNFYKQTNKISVKLDEKQTTKKCSTHAPPFCLILNYMLL